MNLTGQSRALPTWVVDDPTTNNWFNGEQGIGTTDTTKTTGRIWTDKTVFGDDAVLTNTEGTQTITVENDNDYTALVSLSALSSAATIRTSDTEVQPLDIVLVLDTSEDMNTPMEDGTTRIDALKKAANAFVSATLAENQSIDDATKHHRISLVKFGGNASDAVGNQTYYDEVSGTTENNTQIVTGLDYVNDESDLAALSTAITGLTATGDGSQINLGLEKAQESFGQASPRSDAKKVIIVLSAADTPKTPNWDPVLQDSVNGAAEIKDSGTDIYCIGVFDRSDATAINGSNRYMQAISSNYPNASASGTGLSDIDLGDKGEGNYYYAATDSAALSNIFTEIQEQITNSATSPIEPIHIGEDQTRPGNLTFVDQLGDFMEVKNFKSIVFAGEQFTQQTSPVTEGNVTTYKFVGSVEGNAVYGSANLNSITIQVESYGDAAQQGDKVTVTVPASMIPLRYYEIEEYEGTIIKHDYTDAYPLRVFYTVGVKDNVLNALDEPSTVEGLEDYIAANGAGDNDVEFYSNTFEAEAANGKTTATFTPATTNSFYYFTEPTQLYTDAQCTQPLQGGDLESVKNGGPYYYERVWYEGAQRKTESVMVESGSDLLNHISQDEYSQWSIDAGTPRLTRAEEFVEAKDPNRTGTATNVISPSWSGSGNVTVSLGNNGKVTHTVPGNLDISKTVDWGNGTEVEDTKFEFVVDIAGDTVVPGDFTFTIYDGEGTGSSVNGGTGTIQDGDSVFLEDGQHVVIEDIPGGLTYTVTEKVPAGFTANGQNSQDDEGNAVRIEDGTITSNGTATETFTNVYHANEVVLTGEDNLVVTKSLGRDWLETDSFDFTLKAGNQTTIDAVKNGDVVIEGLNASLGGALEGTESVSLTINNGSVDHQSAFGDITFKKPGTYVFEIAETKGDIGGITYDESSRTVTVIVTDNNQGQLTIEPVTVTPADSGLTFSNTYTAVDKTDEDITGTKKIEGRSFKEGDSFTFTVNGTGVAPDGTTSIENVPLPVGDSSSGAAGTFVISPTEDSEATIDFGAMTFTQLGTYTYTFKEAQGAEGNGITYDTADKTVTVTVTDENLDGEFEIEVAGEENLIWNNKYEAEPGEATISGNKQLEGRNWIADYDSFEFKLTPADEATKQAIAAGDIKGFDTSGTDPVLTVNATTEGDFSFAELTFSKVTAEDAPYNFIIEEVVPDGASENKLNGITYDTHKAKVGVTVTDDGNGQLTATPTYSTVEGEASTFTNTYAPEPTSYDFSFGGAKTVTVESGSYTLGEGDFAFILKPVGNAPMPKDGVEFVNPDDPTAGIKVTNGTATNNSAPFSFAGSITFTEAGTYQYTVSEDTTDTVPGITFDTTEYTIQVPVTEDKKTGELTVGEPTVVAPNGTSATPDALAFTNTFDAEKASLSIPGTKTLNGRGFAPTGDTFSFNVSVVASDGGSAVIPEDLGTQQGVSDVTAITDGYSYTYTTTAIGDGTGESASHTFDFGSITYDRAGTYTFTITEVNGGTTVNGMTYDNATHTVVVKVSQNDQAALTAEIVSIDSGDYVEGTSTVAFTNTYSATDTYSVSIKKQLINRDWNSEDSFTFTLAASDDATKTAVKDGIVVLPGVTNPTSGGESAEITIASTDGVEGTYAKSFENIQFNRAGTYKFLAQEIAPEDASSDVYQGVNYDTNPRLVTITVSHDYQGGFTFSQKVTTQDGNGAASLVFNNRYNANPDTLSNLTVTKTLVGREWIQGDSFSFTLAADPDDPTTVAAVKNGGSVQLPGYGETAKVTIPAAGEDLPEGESGTATFNGIKFLEEGTYHFILTEDAHNRPNVSHDDATKHLTVEVTDNQEGSLAATPTWADDEQPTFTNTYTPNPDSLALQVQKTLPGAAWGNGAYTGRDWADNESFGFTVELTKGEATNVVMPEHLTVTVGKPASGQTGTSAFDEIQFKAEGTYEFTITETSHIIGETTLTGDQLTNAQNGMTYDGHTATVTVTVEDDPATGDLVATPTYANTGASTSDAVMTNVAAFTNTYAPTTVGQPLTVTKVLQNRSWDDMSFAFTLTLDEKQSTVDVAGVSAATAVQLPDNAATLTIDSNDTVSSTVTNAKTDSFGAITFKAPGTYVFQVSETVPKGADGNNKYNGITYDATPCTVTVTVADNGNGGLAVTKVEGDKSLTFTNTYGATGVLDGEKLSVTKELTGRPWNDSDNFTFQIAGVSAVDENKEDITPIPMPNGGNTISTATAGQFSFVGQGTTEKVGHFGDITFTQAGDYTYEVRETTSSGNGVAVATNSYQVYVNVTDDGQGNLTAGDPVFENVTKPGQSGSSASSMHFTNKYDATDAPATINIQKTLTGRNWENDDAFTFTLKRITTDAPMPAGAQGDTATVTLEPNESDANPTTGAFNITFTKEAFDKADTDGDMKATFEYEVTETGADGNGLTLDKHAAKVTIAVTDNGSGALSASVAYDNNTENAAEGDKGNTASAAFTNTYEAQPVTLMADADLDLAGEKVMTGRDFESGDTFTFQITKPQGSTAPDPSKTSVEIKPTSGKEYEFTFDDDTTFTFDEAGTYVYFISEVNPNIAAGGTGLAGVDYDTLNYRLTVTIEDNGDGQLVLGEHKLEHQSATDSNAYESASSLVFTNEYNAEQVTIQLRAHKTLSGRTLEAGEFGFQLVAHGSRAAGTDGAFVEDATQPMPTDAEAQNTTNSVDNVTFGSMTFKQDMIGKEFKYGVIELQPTQDGTYNGAPLEGAERNTEGNWVYKGVTYTHEEQIITATVDSELVSGVETVRVTTDGEPATFANTYDAADGSATIQVQKSVANRPWNDGETFGFTLKPVDGAPMPDDATELTATATTESEAVGFQTITYTKDDLDGAMSKTFEYTVTENLPEGVTADAPTKDGLTYATDSQTVKVTVTDNGDGTITATPSGVAAFTNTYDATDGTATIQVQKSVANRPWNQGETFGFTLTPVDGAPMPDDAAQLTAMATAENTPASFPQITYTKTDLGDAMSKTFEYTVTENLPEGVTADAPAKDGLTYATTPQTVMVTVTDNGDGTITANPSVAPTFTNTYETADGTAVISIQKTLTGRDWLGTDTFSFTVTRQTENAPMPDGATGDSVTVDVAPSAPDTAGTANPISGSTGAITFTKADLGGAMTKDFVYTVTENDTKLGGVAKDTHTATVTIKVTDNGNGTITAVPTYSNNAEGANESDAANTSAAAFTNTYTAAPVERTLSVEKVVTGANAPEDFEFALTLSGSNQGPADGVSGLDGNTAKVAAADLMLADGAEQDAETTGFDELTFSKEGVYTFDVTEKTDDYNNGWTYDNDTAKKVTVTVDDNNEGALVVTDVQYNDNDAVAADADTAVTFTNRYTAGAAVVDNLSVTKRVEGNATDEDFTFELTLTSGDAANVTDLDEGDKVTATAADPFNATTNDVATQEVTFPALTFSEPGDYTFTVTETNTAPASTSWTYGADNSNDQQITVKVRDNGTGSLVVDGTDPAKESGITGNNPTIVNRYDADGAATITVKKAIENRGWLKDDPATEEYEGDSFDFTLTATGDTLDAVANGNVVMPTGNGANATITSDTENHRAAFGEITFNVPGTYTFDVTEQGQSHDGLTYDTTPKQVTIQVDDAGSGKLNTSITAGATNDVVTITNTYGTTGAEEVVDTATFGLTKELVDTPWNGQSFSFTITPQRNAPEPEKLTASANAPDKQDGSTAAFDFGKITFNAVGDYMYVITEDKVEGDYKDGIHYDTTSVTVTVHVTDDLHGGFNHTITVAGNDATFTNTYGTELDFDAAGGVEIVKNMTGADITGGEFEFTVTPTGDNAAETAALLGHDGEKSWTLSTKGATADLNDEGVAVATEVIDIVDEAALTHEHDGDTYQFTVAETKGGNAGYDNDGTRYLVTIAVEDNAAGELKATTTVEVQTPDADHPHQGGTYVYSNIEGNSNGGTAQVVFDNTYNAEGSVPITGHKTLNNAQLTGNEFGFTVYDAGNNPDATARNDADGNISLTLSYTIAQLNDDAANNICALTQNEDGKDVYTYQYTVKEDGPLPAGMTANKGADGATVAVTNNGDGTLSTQVTYDSGDQLQFVNTYGTVGDGVELNVGGTKKLVVNSTGDKVPTLASIEGQYEFTLSGVATDGSHIRAPGDGLTAKNTATGDVDFGTITYNIENVWGDEAVTTEVTDDSAPATDEATDATDGATDATDTTATTAGATLSDGDDAGDGTSVEPRIAPRTRTFQYTVSESGSVAGIKNGNAQVFYVTVTDNLDGTVDVKCTAGNIGSSIELTPGDQFTITNEYNAKPVGPTNPTTTGELAITKTLDNRTMNEGEFSFTMAADQDYGGMTGTTSIVATNGAANGVNQASVTFADGFTFTKVGKYLFKISENDPDLGGIVHDTSVYYATADVTDNGQGQLVVDWTVTDADGAAVDAITFENQYVIEQSASVVFGATKALAGKDLAGGQFTFELKDADGNVLQTATNTADGSVVFAEPVEYWEAGEYTYTISEVNDGQANVTYDETVYTATVTVKDNLDGTLAATVSYGADGQFPAFENTYTEPLALGGTDGTPQTGDPTSLVLPAALAAGGVALVSGTIVWSRRRNR